MAEAAVCGITLSALLGLLIVALRKGRGFSWTKNAVAPKFQAGGLRPFDGRDATRLAVESPIDRIPKRLTQVRYSSAAQFTECIARPQRCAARLNSRATSSNSACMPPLTSCTTPFTKNVGVARK